MHSVNFPDGTGAFHFNSDFSGKVKICVREDAWEAKVHAWQDQDSSVPAYVEIELPGEAIQNLVWTVLSYKLGDLGDKIAEMIAGEFVPLRRSEYPFCPKCGSAMQDDHCNACGLKEREE